MTPELYGFMNSIRAIVSKHHPVLFISLVCLLLAGAVFSLYQVLEISSTPVNSNATQTSFDQVTVDKIKNLHDSSDSTDSLVFPSPRINPFSE